jgi:hypothetical protein
MALLARDSSFQPAPCAAPEPALALTHRTTVCQRNACCTATAVHTFMVGLGGLAADGLETVAFEDADARLAVANAHIAATLAL